MKPFIFLTHMPLFERRCNLSLLYVRQMLGKNYFPNVAWLLTLVSSEPLKNQTVKM